MNFWIYQSSNQYVIQ